MCSNDAWMSMGRKKMPSDDIPTQMVRLIVELLRNDGISGPTIGGAWNALQRIYLRGRSALGSLGLELDFCGLAVTHLRAMGSADEWMVSVDAGLILTRAALTHLRCVNTTELCVQSISRGHSGRAGGILCGVNEWFKCFHGQAQRPDLDAIVASGLFEECAMALEEVAAGGKERLHDVQVWALQLSLACLRVCRSQPGCEARIRKLASALAFCLENDMVLSEELGMTIAGYAAQIGEPRRADSISTASPHLSVA